MNNLTQIAHQGRINALASIGGSDAPTSRTRNGGMISFTSSRSRS